MKFLTKMLKFTQKSGNFSQGFWIPTREEVWPEDSKVPAKKQSSEVPVKNLNLSPGEKSETWKPLWKPLTP